MAVIEQLLHYRWKGRVDVSYFEGVLYSDARLLGIGKAPTVRVIRSKRSRKSGIYEIRANAFENLVICVLITGCREVDSIRTVNPKFRSCLLSCISRGTTFESRLSLTTGLAGGVVFGFALEGDFVLARALGMGASTLPA